MKAAPISKSELKSRSEQPDTDNRPKINLARRKKNRELDKDTLLKLLSKKAPELFTLAQVVGSWVWISFPDKQAPNVTARLSEFGFHWNRLRQAWQHPCGSVQEREDRLDPREKYGSVSAAQPKPDAVACA